MVAILRQVTGVLRSSHGDPLFESLSPGFLAGFSGVLIHRPGANTFTIVRIKESFRFHMVMVILYPEITHAQPQRAIHSPTLSGTVTAGTIPQKEVSMTSTWPLRLMIDYSVYGSPEG